MNAGGAEGTGAAGREDSSMHVITLLQKVFGLLRSDGGRQTPDALERAAVVRDQIDGESSLRHHSLLLYARHRWCHARDPIRFSCPGERN